MKHRGGGGLAWVGLAVAAMFMLGSTRGASGDSFNFANLTPTDGATIAYADWYNAGSYVTFTIQPDSNYPCGSEYYWLEVNGTRAAQFGAGCSASVYLPTPGRYSWRTVLYVFQTGTTVNGPVTTFTVATVPSTTSPTLPPTTTKAQAPSLPAPPPSTDSRAPKVTALDSLYTVAKRGSLLFRASDNSGRVMVSLGVFAGKREIWQKVVKSLSVQSGVTYAEAWMPARVGTYRFCALAKDTAGNQSKTSCATVNVVSRA